MIVLKNMLKKLIIMTIIISILISFSTIPASYAKLDIKSDEFYYAGTQKGQYVAKEGVFSWLINALAEVADWIVGAISMAIRAPFIGWTALIERLLTGALEATAGLDMDNNMICIGSEISEKQVEYSKERLDKFLKENDIC